MAADERACLGRLMTISCQSNEYETSLLTEAVDGVLGCRQRYACLSHLACSWMASELANQLIKRCG